MQAQDCCRALCQAAGGIREAHKIYYPLGRSKDRQALFREAPLAQFKINTEANSITPLTARTFGELGFKERSNLQEWIAKQPSCLGDR